MSSKLAGLEISAQCAMLGYAIIPGGPVGVPIPIAPTPVVELGYGIWGYPGTRRCVGGRISRELSELGSDGSGPPPCGTGGKHFIHMMGEKVQRHPPLLGLVRLEIGGEVGNPTHLPMTSDWKRLVLAGWGDILGGWGVPGELCGAIGGLIGSTMPLQAACGSPLRRQQPPIQHQGWGRRLLGPLIARWRCPLDSSERGGRWF